MLGTYDLVVDTGRSDEATRYETLDCDSDLPLNLAIKTVYKGMKFQRMEMRAKEGVTVQKTDPPPIVSGGVLCLVFVNASQLASLACQVASKLCRQTS